MWCVIRIFASFCDMPIKNISIAWIDWISRIKTIVNDTLWNDGILLKWDEKTKVKILIYYIYSGALWYLNYISFKKMIFFCILVTLLKKNFNKYIYVFLYN